MVRNGPSDAQVNGKHSENIGWTEDAALVAIKNRPPDPRIDPNKDRDPPELVA
jgi:hypothetical protein